MCIFTTSSLPIHLSIDIWGVYTVLLLLIMLLPTLGCVFLFKSTKLLLYPRGKYLALEFWNYRVALFLTSFLKIFFMIVTEREAETQAEGEAGFMHQEPKVGFDPRSSGSHPGPKTGTNPLHHPGIPLFFNFSRTLHTVFHSDYICSHAHQECKGATLSPKPHQHLLFLVLLILAIMTALS